MGTGKSATFAPPHSGYSAAETGGHHSFPHFSDSTSPRLAAFPIGWSGSHTANLNGGDLYPYDDETAKKVKCDSQCLILFLLNKGFILEIYTL